MGQLAEILLSLSGWAALAVLFTLPALEFEHKEGQCSITGGYVYRGTSLPQIHGTYVFGDLCDARLRIARLRAGGARRDRALGVSVPQTVSFGEDARGRVYAVSLAGGVFRLAPRP